MARTVSKTEIYVGYTILIVLLVISGGILLKQSKYDPSIFTPTTFQPESPALTYPRTSSPPDLIQYAPKSLTALTPPETFGPKNLSDKINGKAELYLSAGFVNLASQRFAIEDEPTAWMEAFIYEMDHSFTKWIPHGVLTLFTVCRKGLRPQSWTQAILPIEQKMHFILFTVLTTWR
jgi:hypothetical protein